MAVPVCIRIRRETAIGNTNGGVVLIDAAVAQFAVQNTHTKAPCLGHGRVAGRMSHSGASASASVSMSMAVLSPVFTGL